MPLSNHFSYCPRQSCSFVDEFTGELNQGPTQLFIASLVQVWEESLGGYLAQFMILVLFASCSATQYKP